MADTELPSLGDEIEQLLAQRMRRAPSFFATQVGLGTALTPEKTARWALLKECEEDLLALAREMDDLYKRF